MRWLFGTLNRQPAFGQLVTGNYFRMLGVGTALGRTLEPADEAQAGFGGLGETPPDFWAPISLVRTLEAGVDLSDQAHPATVQIIGRVRPGSTVDQATTWFGGYFDALSISLHAGRTFSPAEELAKQPVAVVNTALAKKLWATGDPVGRSIRLSVDSAGWGRKALATFRTVMVIGIAANAVTGWIGDGPEQPVLYLPTNPAEPGTSLIVATAEAGDRGLVSLRANLEMIDPSAVDQSHTLDQGLAVNLYPFRIADWLSLALGAMTLILTGSGIYGVLSYLVAQRTREIGVRMALGAGAVSVVGLVLRQTGRLAALGVIIGLALAFGASRLLGSTLETIDTLEPAAYAGAVIVVGSACLLATLLPSWKAAEVDPLESLRHE